LEDSARLAAFRWLTVRIVWAISAVEKTNPFADHRRFSSPARLRALGFGFRFFFGFDGVTDGLDLDELLHILRHVAVDAPLVDGKELEARGVGDEGAGVGDGLCELALDAFGGREAGYDAGAEFVAGFLFFGRPDVDVTGEAVPVCIHSGRPLPCLGTGPG